MGKENEINVKLIQHTPLLHFQYDSEGATLRATEVKPKLDRFLISKLPRTTREGKFEQCEELLVGYSPNPQKQRALRNRFCKEGFNALNYKMQISAQGRDTSVTLKNMNYPLVLSTMGREPKHIDLCIVKEGKERMRIVELSINISICVKKEGRVEILRDKEKYLRKLIKDNIVEFFALNNFGQRSDKGFGSFTVWKVKDDDGEQVLQIDQDIKERLKNYQYFEFTLKQDMAAQSMFYKTFSVIDYYWRALKSGINYPRSGAYVKSYLYQFVRDENSERTWDKKAIKTKFNLFFGRKKDTYDDSGRTAIFARALLGYPSNGYSYNRNQYTVSVTNNKGIDRLASPIFFKPVFNSGSVVVYILFNEDEIKCMRDKGTVKFRFECRKKSREVLEMPTDMRYIDYKKLIDSYHKKNGYRMIPKNIKWENIISNGKGEIILSKPKQN